MADIDAVPTATDTSSEGGTLVTDQSAPLAVGTGAQEHSTPVDTRQALKDGASKYGAQATDRIRTLADTGKQKAGGALDEFSTLLTDAAGQVDEKLGAQYGDYARQAAGLVSNFSDTIKTKNVDDLLEDARGIVRQSPAVAIGVAAALGFVLARLAQSGIDAGPSDQG